MHQSSPKGVFLTIEGVEGVGKSTAVRFIQKHLSQANQAFVLTREPGGTPVAEEIRQILLKPRSNEVMASETELLLMFACRAQNIAELVKPALDAGKWVICDRFVDASFAYQGGGRQLSIEHIEMLESWIVAGYKPHVTILLDASPKIGFSRTKNRASQDRIEQEKLDFFERVRTAYLQRAQQDPQRFCIINAEKPLKEVHAEIASLLDKMIMENHCEKRISS